MISLMNPPLKTFSYSNMNGRLKKDLRVNLFSGELPFLTVPR